MLSTTLLVCAMIASDPQSDLTLFNGQNLDGWVAEGVSQYVKDNQARPVWTVEDGMLVCTGKGFGFLRYDRQAFTDFVFHVEFRLTPDCNSGLGIRTRSFDPEKSRATRPSFYGYEIQLCDDSGKPPTVHSSGSLYRYVAPRKNQTRPAGEWNSIDIHCIGSQIKVVMNNETIIDFDQQSTAALREKPVAGYVCLQNHGGKIDFRAIRVRELASPPRITRQ